MLSMLVYVSHVSMRRQGDLIAKNEVMADKSMFTRYVETGFGQDIGLLAMRYLPPGSIAFLYARYSVESGPHAKYATFHKEWDTHWRNTLRFRQPSDFCDCRDCASLKHRLENCASLHEKAEVARDLQHHHRNIAYCRDFEEVLRTTPPYGVAKPILAVFTDGMANTHWCIPRLRKHRGAKSLSALPRPKCKVQGVWVFYYGVHLFVADSTMPHDADMTCEVVARALQKCKEVAALRGQPLPEEVAFWTDGTTRENRNNTFLQFIAFLRSSGMFKFASLFQHDMGHTHNILDQLYGIIKRAFQYVDQLEDLDAIIEALRSIMARPGLSDVKSQSVLFVLVMFCIGMEFNVYVLNKNLPSAMWVHDAKVQASSNGWEQRPRFTWKNWAVSGIGTSG